MHDEKNEPSAAEVVDVTSPLTGITLKVLSVAVFVGMSSCIKASGQLPAGQIVFFRSFFAIFPILMFLAFHGELHSALVTKRPLDHVLRGVVGVASMGLGFFGLTRLPLPEAITLNYAQPLLVVVFSALFLGESIRIYRWSAVFVGLIGVLIISWPKLTLFSSPAGLSDQQAIGVAAALASAGISAVALLLVRNLVRTEKTATIVLCFSLTASVGGLLTVPFGWHGLTPQQVGFLVAAGFCGGVAQILMTEAYRHAEASTVAPFEYTSMILGIIVGYLAFGDIPTIHTLIGGAIVVAAGIFIIWRERRLGLRRGAARKVVPPQG
jgi:drug/metabolite transporter (DMT)-like permease